MSSDGKLERRQTFALLARHYLPLIRGSLGYLADVTHPDGTDVREQLKDASKYHNDLAQRLRVISQIVPAIATTDRFVDRLACCVQDLWHSLPRQVSAQFRLCKDRMPKRNPSDHISRCLALIHADCTHHQELIAQLICKVERVVYDVDEYSLDLEDITKQYPLAREEREKIEEQLIKSKNAGLDYPVTPADYGIGLGFTDRYLANHIDEHFPEPLAAGGNTYSLRAVHSWFRKSSRKKAGDGSTKRPYFDPVRVPKLWEALAPAATPMKPKRPYITTQRGSREEIDRN